LRFFLKDQIPRANGEVALGFLRAKSEKSVIPGHLILSSAPGRIIDSGALQNFNTMTFGHHNLLTFLG